MLSLGRLLHRVVGAVPSSVVSWLGRAQFQHPLLARALKRLSAPMRQTSLPIQRGAAAGMLITANSNPGYALGTTEPEVQEALSAHLRPGDVFYDIGAGVGFFTLLAARQVTPNGRVVALEPNPETAERLRRNVELNGLQNVEVIERAVAADNGRAVITSAGTASRLAGAEATGPSAVAVSTVSIDRLVDELGGYQPSLVKLDIEGAECEALRGMTETIASAQPKILCETHGTLPRVRALLEGTGYHTQLLDPEVGGQPTWNVHLLAIPGGTPERPSGRVG